MVFGEKHAYAFGFFGHTSDGTQMRALAEMLLATIKLPPGPVWEPMSPYFLGSLLAVFLVAGILSRIIWRRLGRTLKAAFVAKFVKYVTWPPERQGTDDEPLVVGVFGQDPFGEKLEAAFKGRKASERRVWVRRFHSLEGIGRVRVVDDH